MAKILLVEDSEQIWDFLSRRLERRGHTVVLAHDGEQGVNLSLIHISAHIEYVRASEVGATVEARACEVHLGRRTAVYRVEVCSGAKLLALFTGTVYRKTGQPASLSAKVG